MNNQTEREAFTCTSCGTSWTAPVNACPTCGKRSEDAYLRSTVANAKRLDEAMAEVYPETEHEALVQTIASSLAMSYGSHVNAPKGGRDWKAAEDLLGVLEHLGLHRPTPRAVTTREVCPSCGGLDGAHGLVHERFPQGGGGINKPCPKMPSTTPRTVTTVETLADVLPGIELTREFDVTDDDATIIGEYLAGLGYSLAPVIDLDDEALRERLFAAALAATGYADTDEGRNAAIALRHDLIDRGGIAAMLAEVAK